MERLSKKFDLIIHDSPLFLLTNEDLNEYNDSKKSKTYFHKHFYDWQLKKLDIPYISKSYDSSKNENNRHQITSNDDYSKNENDNCNYEDWDDENYNNKSIADKSGVIHNDR